MYTSHMYSQGDEPLLNYPTYTKWENLWCEFVIYCYGGMLQNLLGIHEISREISTGAALGPQNKNV